MTHHTHHEQWHRNIIATRTNGRPSKANVEIDALPQVLFALGVVCRVAGVVGDSFEGVMDAKTFNNALSSNGLK